MKTMGMSGDPAAVRAIHAPTPVAAGQRQREGRSQGPNPEDAGRERGREREREAHGPESASEPAPDTSDEGSAGSDLPHHIDEYA